MVVPRHQLADLHAVELGEAVVDLGLGGGERLAGQGVQVVEELEEFVAVLLVEDEHHRVVVLEPELLGRLVAQPDEFLQVGLDVLADDLARLPDLAAEFGLGGLLEHLADLAVGHLAAVHVGPEDVELLLDGVGLGGDLLEQRRIDLLLQVQQVEHVDGAGEGLVVDLVLRLLERLQFGEGGLVGQRRVDGVLGLFLPLEVLVLAGGVGVPPRLVGGHVERPELRLVGGDELLRPVGGVRVGEPWGR